MKYLIEKRNYIIIFVIIILIFWIFINLNSKKIHLKSFDFNGKIITIKIYEDINEGAVYKKINDIYSYFENYEDKLNGKLDNKMKSFIEYGKVLYNKTFGNVDITSGDLLDKLKDNDKYLFSTKINDLDISSNMLKNKINFNIDNIVSSYATSEVIDYFKDLKIKKYIINDDGNIIAGERYNNGKYKCSISDSLNKKVLKIVNIENESMYTLNNSDDLKGYMVNPKKGVIEKRYDTVVVISKDNLTANMVASNLYLLSIDEGKEYAKRYNSEALWHYNNEIYMTDNFSKYINLQK